jgi:hypothetical protein
MRTNRMEEMIISGNVFKTSFIPFGSQPDCSGWLRGMS